MSGANDYDCSNNNASVEINSGNIDNVAALLRGITGLSDAVNGALATTGSSTGVTYTRSTSQSGTIAISLSGSSSFAMTANIPQEAAVQSDSYTVPRTLVDGDTLKVTIDGTTYSQTFLNNSNATIANLAGNIDNLPYLGATASGNTITITSTTAGNAYTTGNLTITHASLANQTISNTVGNTAVQSIAFGADFVTGDIVEVTVNGTLTSTPYATSSIATIGSVATAISTVSGVSATASGSNEIIVTATQTGANLAINQTQVKNSSSSTVIQSNEVAVAQSDSYTLPYPLVSGTTVSGDINGTPVSQAFTTDENDTLTLLAGKLETAGPVNASFSGGNQTLTLLAKTPGTGYSSSLRISGESVTPENKVLNTDSGAQVENYSFSRNLVDGEVLQVTVDGSGITQNFITDTPTTLTALATQINDLSGVNAALAGSTIIVTAAIAGIPFIAGTLTIDMGVTGIPVTANRPAQQQIEKFTAARNLVAGDVITATVNDMTLTTSYSGSEAETLAKLASDIDALSGVTATAA